MLPVFVDGHREVEDIVKDEDKYPDVATADEVLVIYVYDMWNSVNITFW